MKVADIFGYSKHRMISISMHFLPENLFSSKKNVGFIVFGNSNRIIFVRFSRFVGENYVGLYVFLGIDLACRKQSTFVSNAIFSRIKQRKKIWIALCETSGMKVTHTIYMCINIP